MKVTLINYTQNALETLLFTKSTRLKMSATGLEDIIAWPMEKKMAEWAYMQNTIRSSWEFADYVFMIEAVSRAFTLQLVRHRVGTSFAQQTQRAVDMSGFEYVTTGTVKEGKDASVLGPIYESGMAEISRHYESLLANGANPQDARGILPSNICTNIVFKANLRTLNGMCAERLCVKAQAEFQNVLRAIRDAVIAVHPWAEPALRVYCAQTGTCCFPSYNDCPIKGGVYNPETGRRYDARSYEVLDRDSSELVSIDVRPDTKDKIHALWEVTRSEAQPRPPAEDRKRVPECEDCWEEFQSMACLRPAHEAFPVDITALRTEEK